jgi:glycosyltransferase involved in cell wall biosynthesis
MKAKILVINPQFYVYGGAERQIMRLCNYLTDRNYSVTLLTTSVCDELRRDLKETRLIVAKDMNELSSIAKAIVSKYDIINPHNHPAEFATMPYRTPIVWQSNEPPIAILNGGDIPEEEKKLVKMYVNKAVVITDFEQERFEKIYGFKPEVNYPGVTHFPEFDEKRPAPIDRFNLKNNFVLLQVGMFTFTKNQVKTVEIFSEVKKRIPNAKLVLVGYDKLPYKYEVDNKINELGLQDDVLTFGYINDDKDIRDLYHFSHIQIAPVGSQGGWMTCLQSTLVGKPFITSKEFVAKKLVEENNLGVIEDVDKFADKIVEMHDNYEKYSKDAVKAGEWIKENLTWDKFCERYSKIFDDAYEH